MQLFLPPKFSTDLAGTSVILDTDFLNLLFKHPAVMEQFFKEFPGDLILLDSLTIFEFLRDMYVAQERIKREEFLSLDFFVPMTKNQLQVNQLDGNALLLSKLYAHNGVRGASFIDLRLAARLLLYTNKNYILITGNKKHFPSCIFEAISIITVLVSEKEIFLNFPMLRLDYTSFESARLKLVAAMESVSN